VNQDTTTAADMLARVGRALFEEEGMGRLAAALNVRRDTLRKWLHGTLPIDKSHPVFRELLELVRRRRGELQRAEKELGAWLEPTPQPSPDRGGGAIPTKED
jgi:hypothetical protein